jgi:hypothetical protein
MKYNLDTLFILFCIFVFIGLFCMVYNINLLSKNNFNISSIYNKLVRKAYRNEREGFKVRDDFSNKKLKSKIKKVKTTKKDPFDVDIDYSKYGDEDFYEQFNNTNQRLNNIRTNSNDNDKITKLNKKNIKYHKRGRKSKMASKLEQFKKHKHSGSNTGSKTKSNFTDTPKKNNKRRAEDTLSALKQISNDANPGSVDTFQNVLDELDNIDAGTFKFKNISGVVSHYNDNLKNRLKYADKKGYNSYDKTVAKGGVLFDELKKLMSYTSLT